MDEELFKKGLEKRSIKNDSGKDESIFLYNVENILTNNKTKADQIIEKFHSTCAERLRTYQSSHPKYRYIGSVLVKINHPSWFWNCKKENVPKT